MKFDQAINEGFEKYVSDTSDKVQISKDLLEKISVVLEFASSKITHDENPDVYKNLIRTYFKVNELIKNPTPSAEDEDEFAITGRGSKDSSSKYDVDDAVERLAQKPTKQLGVFGVGTSAYQANRAVKNRVNVSKLAVKKYEDNTNNLKKALQS